MTKVKEFKTKALNAEDNIFTALGFDLTTSANLRLRAELMLEIEAVLKECKLTQVGAAKLFGVSQPRVNNLLKGRIDKFTIDTLVNWLGSLDRRVDVVVS